MLKQTSLLPTSTRDISQSVVAGCAGHPPFEPEGSRFAFVGDHLIFGWRSSCERAELILALVINID
jgi:hypothetical protein